MKHYVIEIVLKINGYYTKWKIVRNFLLASSAYAGGLLRMLGCFLII